MTFCRERGVKAPSKKSKNCDEGKYTSVMGLCGNPVRMFVGKYQSVGDKLSLILFVAYWMQKM